MNLGAWTDTLAALDQSLPVYFDNGLPVRRLTSWRGRYNELTLDCGEPGDAPRTVADLLEDAKQADGKSFQGYKGGGVATLLSGPTSGATTAASASLALRPPTGRSSSVVWTSVTTFDGGRHPRCSGEVDRG